MDLIRINFRESQVDGKILNKQRDFWAEMAVEWRKAAEVNRTCKRADSKFFSPHWSHWLCGLCCESHESPPVLTLRSSSNASRGSLANPYPKATHLRKKKKGVDREIVGYGSVRLGRWRTVPLSKAAPVVKHWQTSPHPRDAVCFVPVVSLTSFLAARPRV